MCVSNIAKSWICGFLTRLTDACEACDDSKKSKTWARIYRCDRGKRLWRPPRKVLIPHGKWKVQKNKELWILALDSAGCVFIFFLFLKCRSRDPLTPVASVKCWTVYRGCVGRATDLASASAPCPCGSWAITESTKKNVNINLRTWIWIWISFSFSRKEISWFGVCVCFFSPKTT